MNSESPAGKKSSQICQLCAKWPASSREHLPPHATSNVGEVRIIYIDGNSPSGEIQYHVVHSSDGFWVPVLCEKCNNKTGSRYGEPYKDLISQVSNAAGIEDSEGRVYVYLRGIYPLRILKQMFSMFLCAVPYQPAPVWRGIQEFVLKRDTLLPSSAPFVYLYMNVSRIGRIVPCCGIVELSTHKTIVVSEVSWPPVGIVFSFQRDERFALMEDVTSWGQFRFKHKKDITIRLPRLQVSSHYPLGFGMAVEVEREQANRGLVYLFHVPDDSTSPTSIGALLERRT